MPRYAPLVLALSLLVAGCGGGGGGTVGTEAFPPLTEPAVPPIPTDTVAAETGPSGATGGAGGAGSGEPVPTDEPVLVEGDGITVTIVALSETESFMTIALERAGGTGAVRKGTCASPGEVFHEVGELVDDGTTDVFLPLGVDELTGGGYVLAVGQDDLCVDLTAGG